MLTLVATALIFCAPGYPGSSAEARPAMEAFARALAAAAGLAPGSLTAVYEETDAGGVQRLAEPDAGLVLATLPFFLEHEEALHLTARAMAQPKDGAPLQRWTLVTGKDHPASLEGYAVQSSGVSMSFVRAMAPGLPERAPLHVSGAVLSGLRRAASGEKLALFLDGPQAAALGQLPFAAQLATVETSAPVPVALVATVGKRLDERTWSALAKALAEMGKGSATPELREALEGVQMAGFVPLDEAALAAARAAYRQAR